MKSKNLQRIIGVALSTVVAFSMSAMPVYSETKTKVLAEMQEEEAEDVLSVSLPFDMSFSICIVDKEQAALVASKSFNITNYGDDDVVVVVDSIHYVFNDAENCEASNVPITPEIMQKSDKKLLYMQMLSDEKASIQELVMTDKPSEQKNVFSIGTGENNTASFRFFGSANSNTAVNWKDKDVKVIANFSMYKKDVYEKLLLEEETTEVSTSLNVEQSSEVSESSSEATSEETTEVTTEETTEVVTTEVTEITEQTTEDTVVDVTENQPIYPLDEVILDDDSSDSGAGAGSDFNTSGGAIEVGTTEETTEVSTENSQGGGSDSNGNSESVSEETSETTSEETTETTSEVTSEETSETTSEESTEITSNDELDGSTEDSSEENSSEDESVNADADESGLGKDANGGNSSMTEADAVTDEKVSGDMEEEIEPDPDYPTTSEPPFEEEVEEVEVVEEVEDIEEPADEEDIEEIEEPADEEDIEAE